MRSYRLALSVAGMGLVIAALIIGWGVQRRPQPPAPEKGSAAAIKETPSARHKLVIPPSPATYQIVEAAEVLPKIVQATIDPTDVHVGDTQRFTVIVEDPAQITSVVARIETDHGTHAVDLRSAGEAAAEILAPRYEVLGHKVAFLDGGKQRAANIAEAAGGSPLRYTGEWKVVDTHDTTYRTTFVAKDAADRENSVTITWSDACGIPNSGDWSLSSNGNCALSGVDGVDNGNATINGTSPNNTLTLNNGATFAYNSGKQISVTTGNIAVASGAQISETNLWKYDYDTDTYPSSTQRAQSSQPSGNNQSGQAGWARRYTRPSPDDCNDTNSSAFPGQTAYFSGPATSGSDYDYNCNGANEQQYPNQAGISCTYVTPGDGGPSYCRIDSPSHAGWDPVSQPSIPACGQPGNYTDGAGCTAQPGGFCSVSFGSTYTVYQACQ